MPAIHANAAANLVFAAEPATLKEFYRIESKIRRHVKLTTDERTFINNATARIAAGRDKEASSRETYVKRIADAVGAENKAERASERAAYAGRFGGVRRADTLAHNARIVQHNAVLEMQREGFGQAVAVQTIGVAKMTRYNDFKAYSGDEGSDSPTAKTIRIKSDGPGSLMNRFRPDKDRTTDGLTDGTFSQTDAKADDDEILG